jgi:hypothetical protein
VAGVFAGVCAMMVELLGESRMANTDSPTATRRTVLIAAVTALVVAFLAVWLSSRVVNNGQSAGTHAQFGSVAFSALATT